MRFKIVRTTLSAAFLLLFAFAAYGSQFTDIMARWSRSVKYKNDMGNTLEIRATYYSAEYVEAMFQNEADKNMWTRDELENFKYTFLKNVRMGETIPIRLEFENLGPSMRMAPFDEQVSLVINGKEYRPVEYDPRFNFKLQGKRDGMVFFPRYDEKTQKDLLNGVKSVRLIIKGGISPITEGKKIDFIWDVDKDNPQRLFQGKAAAKLEVDRLIKRLETLSKERRQLEERLAAVNGEIESVNKRMDELSKEQ
ncbi:hypothetical protein TheveDRAFT_0505 [Thermanaerovibrio velox DSM 12556]|uniref:Uncharacterized protein n=1 Tax=Thermanaerovibrio velox DSM 12556 TaxID=926567 RepID=H0UQ37_9BACT|nr:hypothetical protein [Thermanaerovibrio velox]EHM09666.1 hypothetical protein TheveDRAFT_0505 [Thermanaerovibrio velox DSM 12556]